MEEKLKQLMDYLQQFDQIAVAYSGGVDSTFLLKVAKEALGDHVIAVTIDAPNFPRKEMQEASIFCQKENIKQIQIPFDSLQVEAFYPNPKDRCYHCKKEMFQMIQKRMREYGIFVVMEGTNVDDIGDYRPGMRAIEELGIVSPLKELGFTKNEIRQASKQYHLPTYQKPSFACLASRFVYGEKITKAKLEMVEQAEQMLMDLNFSPVRVRIHGTLARIEIAETQMERLLDATVRREINETFKMLGFSYIAVDLIGYRTGSMNEEFVTKTKNGE